MRKSRSDVPLVVVPSVKAHLFSTTLPRAPAASQVGDPNNGEASQETMERTESGQGAEEVTEEEEGGLVIAIGGLFMEKLRKRKVLSLWGKESQSRG